MLNIKNMFKRWLKAFTFDEVTYKDAENANIIELIIMWVLTYFILTFLATYCIFSLVFPKVPIFSSFTLVFCCVPICLLFLFTIVLYVIFHIMKIDVKFSFVFRSFLFTDSNYALGKSLVIIANCLLIYIMAMKGEYLAYNNYFKGVEFLIIFLCYLSKKYYFTSTINNISEKRLAVSLLIYFYINSILIYIGTENFFYILEKLFYFIDFI